mmetsp:Transcript_7450/g.28221  ORF Transcript_7450/g.28221 Transcript_7450/m.28221 type:complete len:334 (-) Transcript_7450:511-1512(-)
MLQVRLQHLPGALLQPRADSLRADPLHQGQAHPRGHRQQHAGGRVGPRRGLSPLPPDEVLGKVPRALRLLHGGRRGALGRTLGQGEAAVHLSGGHRAAQPGGPLLQGPCRGHGGLRAALVHVALHRDGGIPLGHRPGDGLRLQRPAALPQHGRDLRERHARVLGRRLPGGRGLELQRAPGQAGRERRGGVAGAGGRVLRGGQATRVRPRLPGDVRVAVAGERQGFFRGGHPAEDGGQLPGDGAAQRHRRRGEHLLQPEDGERARVVAAAVHALAAHLHLRVSDRDDHHGHRQRVCSLRVQPLEDGEEVPQEQQQRLRAAPGDRAGRRRDGDGR